MDARRRRRHPACHLAGLVDADHQRLDEGPVVVGRQPVGLPSGPLGVGEQPAVRAHPAAAERPDVAVEADVRQREGAADLGERAVPALDALAAVGHVVLAQRLVERRQRRRLALADAGVGGVGHHPRRVVQLVVVVAALLLEAALEAGGEVVGRVRRRLGAEQVERHAAVEVEVALQRGDVDAAERADVVGVVLLHQLHGALDDPADAGGADEHVVGLLLEHEVARPRQRVEARLAQRGQLVLAVAVGEVGEHEERQPVRRRLVEGPEDARLVGVAGVALEHLVRLVAAVAPEVAVQQVHHRPQVPALLDVDLEQVAHVVEARRGEAQGALLLDRRRLGVALDDEEAAQVGPVLARDLLPHRLALVLAEGDAAIGVRLGEEDAPAVVGHVDVAEVGPALLADVDRRAQVDRVVLVADRPELLPPLDELRLPRLERPLQAAVAGEVDVVGDLGVDVDGHGSDCSHLTPCSVEGRTRAGAEAAQGALRADGVGTLEDPVLPRREPGEDLRLHRLGADEAVVGLQPGEGVGREAGPLLEQDADLVGPVDVVEGERHEAGVDGLGGGQVLADQVAGRGEPVVVAPAARRQPGEAVGHRVPAVVRRGQAQRRRRRRVVGVLPGALQHQRAVGDERQLGERAGEAAPGLDEGDERAGRDVEPLERARPVQPDLAGEPVVLAEDGLGGGDGVGVAGRAQHPRPELRLVEAQPQDHVVELAHGGQHPGVDTGGHELVGRRRLGAGRAADRDPRRADGAVELDGDVVVAHDVAVHGAAQRGERHAGTVRRGGRTPRPGRALAGGRARRTRCAGRRRRRGPTPRPAGP